MFAYSVESIRSGLVNDVAEFHCYHCSTAKFFRPLSTLKEKPHTGNVSTSGVEQG